MYQQVQPVYVPGMVVRSVAGRSPARLPFAFRAVHVRYLVHNVAVGRVYLQVFSFTLATKSVVSIFAAVILEMVRRSTVELF